MATFGILTASLAWPAPPNYAGNIVMYELQPRSTQEHQEGCSKASCTTVFSYEGMTYVMGIEAEECLSAHGPNHSHAQRAAGGRWIGTAPKVFYREASGAQSYTLRRAYDVKQVYTFAVEHTYSDLMIQKTWVIGSVLAGVVLIGGGYTWSQRGMHLPDSPGSALKAKAKVLKTNEDQTSVCVERGVVFGGTSKVPECFIPRPTLSKKVAEGQEYTMRFWSDHGSAVVDIR